jgi:hypothetical protein
MTQTIQSYMSGNLTKNEFIERLSEHNIAIDERVNTLIRNTESGSIPPFNEFGKVILRKLTGLKAYNRVDKINLNNERIVNPAKVGRTFGLIQAKVTPDSHDDVITQRQTRYLGETYVPVRGTGLTQVN